MPIAVNFKGREVGQIDGDVYISHRNSKTHFYIKGRGYPITNDVLKYLSAQNIKTVRIIEHGAKGISIFEAPLVKYLNAVMICEGEFEPQRCVPLIEMTKVG